MADILCFTLAAPIASFGAVAGNMARGTLDRPGHSLIVGLIGAALGLEREDARLLAMSEGLRIAVAMESVGSRLRDYHTVQTARERKGFTPATRRQMLLDGDLNTIITERDYLTDVRAVVGVVREGGPFSLQQMADALREPQFTLYLGRKSCPLALPVRPELCEADSVDVALRDYASRHAADLEKLFPVRRQSARIAADSRLYPGQAGTHSVSRRTRPDDRATWRYRLLDELVLAGPASTQGEAKP
jgi:CRISPR system Cascade subunit CasD